MKKIQILGMGCPKCETLAKSAQQAAQELGIEFEMEKVNTLEQIMAMGVMVTPALAIDGKVVSSGKVLPPEHIKTFLQ